MEHSTNGSIADNPLHDDLFTKVTNASLLVVGAGGIGCELLKNLVLTGFRKIEVIDLDTIDVSNLNRQFLFQKCHVGKPKALVARDSVLRLAPDADIIAHYDTIFSNAYNATYFRKFDLVLNALDNLKARNHVNRMCLAAGVTLLESGSAGYLGQVMVIRKGVSECYECHPPPRRKTFPGCTIRNTPSQLIHCVVWAKFFFNQLFGEPDADQDVSPDTTSPDSKGSGDKNEAKVFSNNGESLKPIERQNTRQWARDTGYDAIEIFEKIFTRDISYLLSMSKLWVKRVPPKPISWSDHIACSQSALNKIDQQQILSIEQNMSLFKASVEALREQVTGKNDGEVLYWDKDDEAAMNFTSATANIRALIFGIEQKSRFEIKSMAGNIIPAIATTNAIVAGLIVMQVFDILNEQIKEGCRNVIVCSYPRPNKRLLDAQNLDPPKKDCYVCSEKREVTIAVKFDKLTLGQLRDRILKTELGMLAPDVDIMGRDTVLISSDEDDIDEEMMMRTLDKFGLIDGTRLYADDFLQNCNFIVNLTQLENDKSKDEAEEDEILYKTIKTPQQNQEDEENNKEPVPTVAIKRKADSAVLNETEVCQQVKKQKV